jgi:hypothetical protein
MSPSKVNKIYADLLSHHPFGHALYFPINSEDIRPGSVGFFDHHGHWHILRERTGFPLEPSMDDVRFGREECVQIPVFQSHSLQKFEVTLKGAVE